MSTRWTEDDLAKFKKNSGRAAEPAKKPKKYRNVRTTVDGWTFDSKLEANRYLELKLLREGRLIDYFLRQVPFHLPGGVIFRVDFMIKWRTTLLVEPRITYEDAHGPDTRAKTNKIKQVRELYGVEIQLVRKAAAGR
jgi:hypothetical protein